MRQTGWPRPQRQRDLSHAEIGLLARLAWLGTAEVSPPTVVLIGVGGRPSGLDVRAIGAERHPDAKRVGRKLCVVAWWQGGRDRGIDDDGELDVAAELTGQGIGDQDPQPVLELVLGELVRGRDESRVLD